MMDSRNGSQRAFATLYERYRPDMIRYSMRLVGNRERAEELVQDAFLRIYTHRHSYEPRARFTTFLYRVTRNVCLNELRRGERAAEYVPVEEASRPSERKVNHPTPPDLAAEARETAETLRRVLEELPQSQRRALILARLEDYSYAEVAAELGRTVGAVKSLVFRGTQRIRDAIEDHSRAESSSSRGAE